MAGISFLLAFGAGLLSFVSPCSLPLIPVYVSYVTGASIGESEEKGISRKRIMAHSLLFVLGFSFIFILMGATSTLVGRLLVSNLILMRKIAGLIILFFGLHYSGLLRLPLLYSEKKVETSFKPGITSSLLIGITFAAGWSPCIGPILGSILAYAATYETMYEGILLLSFYSAGFALPFLVMSLGISHFSCSLRKMGKHLAIIQTYTGYFMIILGILVFTNVFQRLSGLVPWPG